MCGVTAVGRDVELSSRWLPTPLAFILKLHVRFRWEQLKHCNNLSISTIKSFEFTAREITAMQVDSFPF